MWFKITAGLIFLYTILNRDTPVPINYGAHEMVMYKNRIYEFGGVTQSLNLTRSTFLTRIINYHSNLRYYDLSHKTWYSVSTNTEPPARAWFAMDICGDVIYIFGGASKISYKFDSLGDFWAYNIRTNRWLNLTTEQQPSARIGAVMKSDGKMLYLFGGLYVEKTKEYNDLWVYNTQTNTWTKIIAYDPPKARTLADMKIYNGSIYITGGEYYDFQINWEWQTFPLKIWKLEQYSHKYIGDPTWKYTEEPTWKYVSEPKNLIDKRLYHASSIHLDTWFFFGGSYNNNAIDKIIGFNFTTQKWCEHSSLIAPRIQSKMVGKYINGGYTNNGYPNEIISYPGIKNMVC